MAVDRQRDGKRSFLIVAAVVAVGCSGPPSTLNDTDGAAAGVDALADATIADVALPLSCARALTETPVWTVSATSRQRFGYQVASAGDVNADGFADVLVGGPVSSYDASFEGGAELFLGSAAGLAQTPAWIAHPTAQRDAWFGFSVSGAGDIDGDGYDDAVFGAFGWSGEAEGEGRAYLYRGGPAGLATTATWSADPTDQPDAHFGRSVAGAGDVNGDGYADVIVGAYFWDGEANREGRAYLYSGSADGLTPAATWVADPTDLPDAFFGQQVASAGDVNADGFADVIIGAPGSGRGVAYVYHGSADGLGTEPAWIGVVDAAGRMSFGGQVAGAGDVNGDGFDDVVVAAYSWAAFAGRIFLFLGGPDGLSETPASDYSFPFAMSFFGSSVAGVGDLDRDGYDDVVVGAQWWGDEASSEGGAFLFRGTPAGLQLVPSWSVSPTDQQDAWFGFSVAGAGDVDGDGSPDVIGGAWAWDDGTQFGDDRGIVYLYSGCPR